MRGGGGVWIWMRINKRLKEETMEKKETIIGKKRNCIRMKWRKDLEQ